MVRTQGRITLFKKSARAHTKALMSVRTPITISLNLFPSFTLLFLLFSHFYLFPLGQRVFLLPLRPYHVHLLYTELRQHHPFYISFLIFTVRLKVWWLTSVSIKLNHLINTYGCQVFFCTPSSELSQESFMFSPSTPQIYVLESCRLEGKKLSSQVSSCSL